MFEIITLSKGNQLNSNKSDKLSNSLSLWVIIGRQDFLVLEAGCPTDSYAFDKTQLIRHSLVPPIEQNPRWTSHSLVQVRKERWGWGGGRRDVEIGMYHFHCRVLEASVSLFYLLLSVGGFRVGL